MGTEFQELQAVESDRFIIRPAEEPESLRKKKKNLAALRVSSSSRRDEAAVQEDRQPGGDGLNRRDLNQCKHGIMGMREGRGEGRGGEAEEGRQRRGGRKGEEEGERQRRGGRGGGGEEGRKRRGGRGGEEEHRVNVHTKISL